VLLELDLGKTSTAMHKHNVVDLVVATHSWAAIKYHLNAFLESNLPGALSDVPIQVRECSVFAILKQVH
jgi:hypothetical protein